MKTIKKLSYLVLGTTILCLNLFVISTNTILASDMGGDEYDCPQYIGEMHYLSFPAEDGMFACQIVESLSLSIYSQFRDFTVCEAFAPCSPNQDNLCCLVLCKMFIPGGGENY